MSMLESMVEKKKRALKIHAVICSNQNHPDFRMGVPSAMNWDALAQRLREGFFRKPFLKNNRSWVRQLVIADPEAFAFLAPHIKLELIVNGHLRYWDGWGNEITRDENNPLDFLKDKMVPHLLEFLLGDNAKMFTGILNFC